MCRGNSWQQRMLAVGIDGVNYEIQGHNHCPNLSVCIRKTKFRRCSRSHFPSFESGA